MAYQGNSPAAAYTSFAQQTFSIVNGQTSYTLDHPVANGKEILLYINNVKQVEGSGEAYTASGNTLTIASALTSGSDEMYCLFIGKAIQNVVPPSGSVTNAMLGETITVANGGTGLTSGFANGITMADQYRLSANLTGTNADITSNLERVDDATFAKIGTGMSESSGIFTFPTTGLYLIAVTASVNLNNDTTDLTTKVSTNSGSSFDDIMNISNGHGGTTARALACSNTAYVNVTDTSTFQIKFTTGSFDAGSTLLGNTAINTTSFTFIRLGDSQ